MEDPKSQRDYDSLSANFADTLSGSVDPFRKNAGTSYTPTNISIIEQSRFRPYSTSPSHVGKQESKQAISRDDQVASVFPTTLSQLRYQLFEEGEATGPDGKFLMEEIERTLQKDSTMEQPKACSSPTSLHDEIEVSLTPSYDLLEELSYSLLYADSDPSILQKLRNFASTAVIPEEETPNRPLASTIRHTEPTSQKKLNLVSPKRPPFWTASSSSAIVFQTSSPRGASFSQTSSLTTLHAQPSSRRGNIISSPISRTATTNVRTSKKSYASPTLSTTLNLKERKEEIERVKFHRQTSQEHQANKR